MLPDLASASVARSTEVRALDFSQRAQISEWMDGPCPYEEMRDCLRDLERVNRLLGAYRPTLRWLEQIVSHRQSGLPLHLVDVGCGGGDLLRRIEEWAAKKHIAVSLTGIDLNPDAVRAAREFSPPASRIQWLHGDAYRLDVTSQPVDIVVSSLFTHHLTDEGIVQFLVWMEQVARDGWYVNDLLRSRLYFFLFKLLSRAAKWHPLIRHDGPVSICRSFSRKDWKQYINAAGLPVADILISSHPPGRLCVSRSRH